MVSPAQVDNIHISGLERGAYQSNLTFPPPDELSPSHTSAAAPHVSCGLQPAGLLPLWQQEVVEVVGQVEGHRGHMGHMGRGKELVVEVEEGAGQSGMVAELNVAAQNGACWESSSGPVQSSGSGSCWRKRRRLRNWGAPG